MLLLERRLSDICSRNIAAVYLGNTDVLFDGSIDIQKAISKNIDTYLQKVALMSWAGIKLNVTVTTKQGELLYPAIPDKQSSASYHDSAKIAADNFRIMNKGLVLNVEVSVEHNTPVSNTILALFIIASLAIMCLHYKSGLKKVAQVETKNAEEINRLIKLEKTHSQKLKSLEEKREQLRSETKRVRARLATVKQQASKNEEDLIHDIVLIEEKLENNLALQKRQSQEIELLKEQTLLSEKEKKKAIKRKSKASDSIQKRFRTLYKDILVNERAISDYLDLNEEMKLKSEEIINLLNNNPAMVPIKRKVFGGKKAEKVLEVAFGYKGRLYYRKSQGGKIEVLTIGTKNTQAKELEFLSRL